MATRLVPTLYQAIDDEGNPGNGYLLYFYTTGTSNPKDTYSDEALTVANANPVPANGAGRFGDIFGATKDGYKIVLTTAADVVIETEDPVDSITYNINSFDPRPAQHWGTTTNTAGAYQIKPDPSITAYSGDLIFTIQAHLDNTAGCTLAVFQEGTVSTYLAALDMMKYDNIGAKIALVAADMQAGQTYLVRIDGTDAVVLNLNLQSTNVKRGSSLLTDTISMSNDTDTDHDILFTNGTFNFSGFDGSAYASALTKQIDSTWAAGDDAGGLSAGVALAVDTWYHCFVLSNANGTTTDFGFDTSVTAANLLADAAVIAAGLTKYSLVESILTDGSSNIIGFNMIISSGGDKVVYWDTTVQDDVTEPETATSIALSTPLGRIVRPMAHATARDTTQTAVIFQFWSGFKSNTAQNEYTMRTEVNDGETASINLFGILTDTSSQIWKIQSDSVDDSFIYTSGWVS